MSTISSFIHKLINLFLPQVQQRQPETLVLICLCTITLLFSGEHTISSSQLALVQQASERRTALPRSITSTERTNAP